MDKIELEGKQDENTINNIAEKLKLVSNTKLLTEEELFRKFVAKNVIENKMITVTGQINIDYEK